VRAVGPAETPILEHDLRSLLPDAAGVVALVRGQLHSDTALEVQAVWDVWLWEAGKWQQRPQPLSIICVGQAYDDEAWREAGHFQADIGFEHVFTGRAGLLSGRFEAQAQHAAEAEFLRAMAQPEPLREYREKTRENVRQLLDWVRASEEALPVECWRLWSEEEEDFEARLDDILAGG